MGNSDGILTSLVMQGTNDVEEINDNAFFSIAYGNEIALVLKTKSKTEYFILNCDKTLWEEVRAKVKETKSLAKLKEFWLSKSKEYEVSDWSEDFEDL